MSLVLLMLGLLFHELIADVRCNNSGVLRLGLTGVVLLLSHDDFVTDSLVSQIVSKDVLKLVARNRLILDVPDQLLSDELVLDEL